MFCLIAALISGLVISNPVAARIMSDSIEAKRFIMQEYHVPLPESIAQKPWSEFRTYLDPYTYIMSADDVDKRKQQLVGIYPGRIGVRRAASPMGWNVVHVNPGTPAYYAGLRVGDVIYSADDVALAHLSEDSALRRVMGPTGTGVVIEYIRNGICHRQVIQRADVKSIRVAVAVVGRTMAVRIAQFGDGIYDEFKAATAHIKPRSIDTVVFDLRGNPGGLVQEAVSILSEFIHTGDTIVVEKYRYRSDVELADPSGRWRSASTLIVLQDSNSASASELFAGALKVQRQAIIIGDTSYGKGRIQRIFSGSTYALLSDDTTNAGVCVTIGMYLAGGSLPVDSIGIIPDVVYQTPVRLQGVLPESFDMVGLRMLITNPTQHHIDSVDNLGYGKVAALVWGERIDARYAIDDVASMRDQLDALRRRSNAIRRTSR